MSSPIEFTDIQGYKIPYYHNPKIDCGCVVCALTNKRISLDFFLGIYLSNYMSNITDLSELADDKGEFDITNSEIIRLESLLQIEEKCLLQFFTKEDLIYTANGSIPTPSIKGE